jgi:hypothetical protein
VIAIDTDEYTLKEKKGAYWIGVALMILGLILDAAGLGGWGLIAMFSGLGGYGAGYGRREIERCKDKSRSGGR